MPRDDYLALPDADLLAQCDVHVYKASGPGGQHRNKVSSAVRLVHRPTQLAATANDSRSQHDNKARALRRLRRRLACSLRQPLNLADVSIPPVVSECLFRPRGQAAGQAALRLRVGPKDARFWAVAAFLLDLLEAAEGRLADAAALAGITTSNLATVFQSERHLLAATQEIRKRFGRRPLA